MKKLIFTTFTLLIAVLFSCQSFENSQQEVDTEHNRATLIERGKVAYDSKTNHGFKELSRSVKYCDPKIDGQDCVEQVRSFIQSNGFPSTKPAIDLWDKSWQEADKMYVDLIAQHSSHSFVNALRWHVSQTILADLALLAEHSDFAQERIYFYTKEMIEAGSTNLDFVAYCLEYLAKTRKYNEFTTSLARQVLDNHSNSNFEKTLSFKEDLNSGKQLKDTFLLRVMNEYIQKKMEGKDKILALLK